MNNNMAENEDDLNSSKRRKLNTTKYLHKNGFVEGRASDVKIIALSREWNLHKILLEKSPYFQCMFSGSWIETTQREINLIIEDANITTEALNKVFESLYTDETVIEPLEVIPILACATLFQLEDLIYHCAEVMKSSLDDIDAAVRFYEASDLYSIKEVKKISLDLLCRHSANMVHKCPKKLNLISHDLMRELVSSPEFCVESEKQIFLMLICWVFFKENYPTFENYQSLLTNARNYFENLENEKAFLETDSGIPYQPVFRALRLQNLILYMDIEEIEKFNVIPKDWFIPVFKIQWYHMFRIHKGSEKGPMSKHVSEEEFNRKCVRIHKVLYQTGKSIYIRNKHFDFGFGLHFLYDGNGDLHILRNNAETVDSLNKSVVSASSKNNKRNLMYRITIYSDDSNFRVFFKAETGLQTVSLTPNGKIRVFTYKPPMNFPVNFQFNFLLTTP